MTEAQFRADHVGSLLRPEPLLAARRRHEAGEIDDARLRAAARGDDRVTSTSDSWR